MMLRQKTGALTSVHDEEMFVKKYFKGNILPFCRM